MLKVGLVGFGGITKVHRAAYAKLEKLGVAKLVCACDIDPEAFNKSVTINLGENETVDESGLRKYTDLDEMLAKETLDNVDICVPTFKHAELTVKCLELGYNVMCEKPMSLTFADCEKMVEAARKSGKELMIGQCVRFNPSYAYLKEVISDGRYGKVISAFFQRISAPPTWGWNNWFMKPELSGGCLTDLHIHDVDVTRYLFGEPKSASCRASSTVSIYDSAHTTLNYGDFPVTVIGDWSLNNVPFSATYRVGFEKASIILNAAKVTVYPKDGSEPFEPEIAYGDSYYNEIEFFCNVVAGNVKNEKNPPESAARSVKLIEALRKSANSGGEIINL